MALGILLCLGAEAAGEALDYPALDAAETRLAEFRDPPEVWAQKVQMLAVINASRQAAGSPPVELDVLASRVANRQAQEAAAHRYFGHWNLAGEKPYHRYAFAGGTDHVSENAAAISGLGTKAGDLLADMVRCHRMFMAETPPNDGHRTNVVDRLHTHVGLGVARIGGEFRYYEEYLDRYLETAPLEASPPAGERVHLRVRPLRPGWDVYAFVVYHEPLPQAMSPARISSLNSYNDYGDKTGVSFWPWELKPDADGWFDLTFVPKAPGLYYLNVYLSDEQVNRNPAQASTRGLAQASGVVLRVR